MGTGIYVCVFVKLHVTAQPGPVKPIFQCYSNGSALSVGHQWLELRRQLLISRVKGDTLSRRFRLRLPTYLCLIYLHDAIVTSFVVLYLPPRNALPILLAIDVNTPISTRYFLSGTVVGQSCRPLSPVPGPEPSYYCSLVKSG